jgi:hypothetical protein
MPVPTRSPVPTLPVPKPIFAELAGEGIQLLNREALSSAFTVKSGESRRRRPLRATRFIQDEGSQLVRWWARARTF